VFAYACRHNPATGGAITCRVIVDLPCSPGMPHGSKAPGGRSTTQTRVHTNRQGVCTHRHPANAKEPQLRCTPITHNTWGLEHWSGPSPITYPPRAATKPGNAPHQLRASNTREQHMPACTCCKPLAGSSNPDGATQHCWWVWLVCRVVATNTHATCCQPDCDLAPPPGKHTSN
jgi:hypothetical protein